GIYWWKAISEGFQKEQLAEVKQQAAEALNICVRGSYHGFGVNIGTVPDMSDSHSKKASQRTTFQNLQTKVQLSVAQTGGPPEANGFLNWKAGLVANNQTWCVTDRGLQLVPVWDIVLSSHRSDFKDPLKVANCLKDSYTALAELTAQIQEGEEFLSIEKEAKIFPKDVKSRKVFKSQEKLERLRNFMQRLSQKAKSNTIWTNICLKHRDLQNIRVNTVNLCDKSSSYGTYMKSQVSNLLVPHIHKVNFPQAHSTMQWIFQSEPKEDNVPITQFSELIEILKKKKNDLREVKANSGSTELVEEAQRKLTDEVSLSLACFLKYLQEIGKPDTHILLLLIASSAGYHVVDNIFQYLLGHDELNFLLDKMQTAQNKYQELKNICNYRAQAFLVLTGLTATAGIKAVSPEEKTQRLALIKHHMGQSLTTEVVYVLSKPGDHDWENLEEGLRLLIDGSYEATVSSLQVEEVRKQLQSVFPEKKEPHEPHDNEKKKEEVIENGAFRDLLQHLGLEHYYPRKMSRANFQLIHKTSVYNTQPCSERELPFYFLQKLMMLDYGLRYLIIKHEEYTENQGYSCSSNQEKEAFDPYEDILEESVCPTKPSAATNVRPYVHPMD
ncbi:LOW QUALITY PROTEIN: interferon-induced very large GTPase 1-like, partial [Oryx dammah]|uniref:LOW QUALITY PROTEIN: interferon-induced very large GTPase 1-like n=1 Tax=Oryx dammah TaxID=59534 RepID=UPI001A9A94C6